MQSQPRQEALPTSSSTPTKSAFGHDMFRPVLAPRWQIEGLDPVSVPCPDYVPHRFRYSDPEMKLARILGISNPEPSASVRPERSIRTSCGYYTRRAFCLRRRPVSCAAA